MEIVAVEDLPEAGGYTPARRQVATLADGTTAFVKTPTSDVTRRMLRDEIAAYEAVGPQPFCPRVLHASPDRLVLEDLRHAHWPPPWRDDPVTYRHQMHVDVDCPAADRDAEVERVKALSATWVRDSDDPDDAYVVLADPEGNLFCVCPM